MEGHHKVDYYRCAYESVGHRDCSVSYLKVVHLLDYYVQYIVAMSSFNNILVSMVKMVQITVACGNVVYLEYYLQRDFVLHDSLKSYSH